MKSYTSWDITPCSPLKVNYVSENSVPFIFNVEEEPKLKTSMTQRANYTASYPIRKNSS
jgi:hypothetical protein